FGAGCYWCIEAVLQQVDGVTKLESGFMGGQVDDPSYAAVCNGTTGHAEVVQLHFNPKVVSYRELLGWFWKLHDPTTLNRQGADAGTQYRSAIYFHNEEQEAIAKDSKAKANKSGVFDDPIVTEVTKADTFWKAKQDHQDYYRQNKQKNPYCQMISRKLMKLGLDY
ncbi:MAG: peptide-methionine (S)-S-oxide reductase, partial [Planctomycetota bacterium]